MAGGGGGGGGGERSTHLHDLPDAILANVFGLVVDVRSRNAMALACRKWRTLERSTRTSLSLRGNVRDLFLLPTCFPFITHLDLSLLSPWGHPFLQQPLEDGRNEYNHYQPTNQQLIAHRLRQSFPNLTSLTVYARNPSTLYALAPQWPGLRHVTLVRWHQRPQQPPGSDLAPLLAACPSLSSLDLSKFYCWTEDIPVALQAHPSAAASLTRINLLSSSSADGFQSSEIVAISSACPNLREFLAPCVFNPRYFDFVGDDALLALASNCPRLTLLHLVDPVRPNFEVHTAEDSRITGPALENLFAALSQLEDLALDLCHNVWDTGPALEALSYRCPRIKSLKLGQFHGICRAAGLHLDGVAVCGALQSLCIKNSVDLTNSSLVTIARGCRRLSKFEIQRCSGVSETGITRLAGLLRSTLVDVRISGCQNLDAASSLRALEPIRDRIQRLHIDCIWVGPEPNQLPDSLETGADDFDPEELEQEETNGSTNKKCRYSDQSANDLNNGGSEFWCRIWDRLRYLSLWIPAGELLSPLPDAGLETCPELEEISIKVEGDCRTCPRPTQPVFGLSCLALYPQLSKMKLDCGDAIGYALTAPTGQMDLSLWERFYLHGIGALHLYELDYWPPQDREVNQRSLSLPATGLIQGCSTLRKLFIHGTAHEHFMRFFLKMRELRDVQLREDYYPAPENDMSTEMRVDSCSRFEDALNSRDIPP